MEAISYHGVTVPAPRVGLSIRGKNKMYKRFSSIIVGLVVLLSGCLHQGNSTNLQDTIKTSVFHARFDPANSIIPYPNNLLFSGATDGTLNIPFDPSAPDAPVKRALNALDGFSTIAPISATFSSAVDSDTLVIGDTVRLFEVTLSTIPGGAVTSIVRELGASEYTVGLSGLDTSLTTVVITPLRPLAPKTSYLAVLTNGIKGTDGQRAGAELPYAMAKSASPLVDGGGGSRFSALSDAQAVALEPVRQLTNAAETAAEAFASDLKRGDIILSWSFTTQSISDVLDAVRAAVQAAAPPVTSLTDSTTDSPKGAADIYVGTITLPYYLTAASGKNDDTPLTTWWTGIGGSNLTWINPSPEKTGDQTVPLMVSIPKGAKPPGGWPVVIYQHGITTNRTTVLAVADALAGAGFAAAAIDMPLHGLTGDETDGTQNYYVQGAERTFDLDLVDNATGAPGPDGKTDPSGKHFINLSSLLTSRDNLRQAVADLLALNRALVDMDYDGGGPDFDTNQVRFLGHSLGAMAGAAFLALEPSAGAASLAMPGGGIAKLLDGSATYGPQIAAGLAANGIDKGTAGYEAFMASAQMVMDSADPINYALETVSNRGVHLIEIVGGSASPSDQVIPNNVLNIPGTVPSPTAGTDPLATQMGLTKASGSLTGTNLLAWVRFTAGHHGSLLTPKDAMGNDDTLSAAVTAEIQAQVAGFLASNGAALSVGDASLLE